MKTPLDGLADAIEREISLGRRADRLSDEELARVLAECDQQMGGVRRTDADEIVWRRLRALAVEARDARAGAR